MGKSRQQNSVQHAFTTGEMSPATIGRQDVQRYSSGLSKLENFLICPQGGCTRRPGDNFISTTKTGTDKSRLIPFAFSTNQAYVLEFGNFYIRFYASFGQVQNGGVPYEIVSPYSISQIGQIQFTQSADILYLTHPNIAPQYLQRFGQTNWTIGPIPFFDGPYNEANTANTQTLTASATTGSGITITASGFSPFDSTIVGKIIRLEESVTSKYDQWITGTCYPNGYLVGNAGNIYQCTNGSSDATANQYLYGVWQNAVAYPVGYHVYWGQNCYVTNLAVTSGSTPPTHTSGTVSNFTYEGPLSGKRAPIHTSGTVTDGTTNWLYLNSGFGIAQITGYTSPTVVTASVVSTLPNGTTGGTLNFRFGAFGGLDGYPTSVALFRQRLCFAATATHPNSVWMSNTGNYYDFAPTDVGGNVLDTNTIFVTIASGVVNKIVWLAPQRSQLLIGTLGGEFAISQELTTKGLSPSNIQSQPQTSYGSLINLAARIIDKSILYVQRSGNRILEMTYSYTNDGQQSKDLNLLSDHILRDGGGVVDLAYQREPYSVIWIVRADGQLASCSYLSDQDVIGWGRHIFTGNVESVACIPGGNNGEDVLYLQVNRTVSGVQQRHISYMKPVPYPTSPQDKSQLWYVEAGLNKTFSMPTSVVTGINHLEGMSVTPIVDGAVEPNCTVTGGTITLQSAGLNIIVGLNYTSKLSTLPLDITGPSGPGLGQLKRINKLVLKLLNSLGFSYGMQDGATIFNESFRTTGMLMNQSPDLFTGDFAVNLPGNYSRTSYFTIEQTQPYPLYILDIVAEAQINED